MKILIIGNRGGTHIGGCLERAAPQLQCEVRLLESRLAFEAPIWLQRFDWWFRDKEPVGLDKFGQSVLKICREWNPSCLIATGIAPLKKDVLGAINRMDISTLNYLTDDPWNPSHKAGWFLDALPFYSYVYSVRRSNIENLHHLGCSKVSYLPFAYDPDLHFPDPSTPSARQPQFESDIVFVGCADRDRTPYLIALIKSGFKVGLYGAFWERFGKFKNHIRGYADPLIMRKAIGGAKVALCLVRRANRDGNSMRTFEIPAIGTCMLTEDTEEHREIFGEEGKAVVYFRSVDEMTRKLRWLLGHEEERRRLAQAAHDLIIKGSHTYKDRLLTMFMLANQNLSFTSERAKLDKLKIAMVVHGRFHAFDLARELLKRNHEVALFTNYPKWAVKRFGFPSNRVRSFWWHGILSRLGFPEAWLHRMFGRWAAKQIKREDWDVVHPWSGISEEIFQALNGGTTQKLLMRGSAHIKTQARILKEEEKRTGVPTEGPSPWMITREEREYALADKVLVLSTFAYQSFIDEGISRNRLHILPLGVDFKTFRPQPRIVEARCRRILLGEAIRVLYVGAFSFQKGAWDLAEILRRLHPSNFKFRLVGKVTPETLKPVATLDHSAEFISKQPQPQLPRQYAWGDVFVFPTIQDGFAQVLAQAYASALPILATTNCSAPDFIREGETGWILPIRSPESFIERLKWCDENRSELAEMVGRIYGGFKPRDWREVASDFEKICFEIL